MQTLRAGGSGRRPRGYYGERSPLGWGEGGVWGAASSVEQVSGKQTPRPELGPGLPQALCQEDHGQGWKTSHLASWGEPVQFRSP